MDIGIRFFHLYFQGLLKAPWPELFVRLAAQPCSVRCDVRCEGQGELIKAISKLLDNLDTQPEVTVLLADNGLLLLPVQLRYLTSYQGVMTGTEKSGSRCFHLQGESDESVFTQFAVEGFEKLAWV